MWWISVSVSGAVQPVQAHTPCTANNVIRCASDANRRVR